MASRGSAGKLLRTGARIVGRHAYKDWFAVYVETPDEEAGRIDPKTYAILQENIRLAESLGANVVKLKAITLPTRSSNSPVKTRSPMSFSANRLAPACRSC